VLVAGGEDQPVPLASAELYDPIADAWTAVGPLTVARSRHAAVTLPNGKVLVAGGFDAAGVALASVELFDVGANRFGAAAPMTTARGAFPLAVLGDGDVLASGGLDARAGARLTAVERYRWASGQWAARAPAST
jgi:hypothetical protein